MAHDHTVKSFDVELRRLVQEIAQMGGLAEEQLAQAIDALARRDSEAATKVIESDRRIDTMEHEGITNAFLVPAVMTVAFHVPRNDTLAALDPSAVGAADAWAIYVREWTVGNHVRTLSGLVASAAFTASLI